MLEYSETAKEIGSNPGVVHSSMLTILIGNYQLPPAIRLENAVIEICLLQHTFARILLHSTEEYQSAARNRKLRMASPGGR